MKCEACGFENRDDVLFCAQCGKALQDTPISLDLEQIKVPASARKTLIKKVNATIKEESGAEEKPPAPQATDNKVMPAAENSVKSSKAAAKTPATKSAQPTEPMKMRNWVGVFLLCMIPAVNVIMLLIWAFSSRTNKNKQSFSRVALIFDAILLVLAIGLFFVYAAFFNPDLMIHF